MKSLIVISVLFASLTAAAQTDTIIVVHQTAAPAPAPQYSKFRINAYAGYVFSDKVDSYYSSTSYYSGTVNGSFVWGIGAEFMIKPLYGLELLYSRQDTKAPVEYYDIIKKKVELDVAINYILLGGVRYFALRNPKIEPYTGIYAGVGIVDVENPDNHNSYNATKFGWMFKAGSNFWLSDRFGIKAQAAIGSIAQGFGGGVYFGTGGAGAGVSSYSTLFQFTLSGGVALKLGGSK